MLECEHIMILLSGRTSCYNIKKNNLVITIDFSHYNVILMDFSFPGMAAIHFGSSVFIRMSRGANNCDICFGGKNNSYNKTYI